MDMGGQDKSETRWGRIKHHLNFFRIHVLIFTFTPVITACIFYAANGSASGNANSTNLGRQRVTFIDSLFVCFSAMTTCGLVPLNISALHPFQQVLLFLLFIIGDPTFVSLIMVLVRKYYFRNHCEQLILNDRLRRTNTLQPTQTVFQGFVTQPIKKKSKDLKEKKALFISGPVSAHKIEGYVEDQDMTGREGVTDSPVEMAPEEGRVSEAVDAEANHSQPSTIGRSTTVFPTNPTSRAESPQAYTTAIPTSTSPGNQRNYPHPQERLYDARQRLRQQTRKATLHQAATVGSAPLSPSRPDRQHSRKATAGMGSPLGRIKSTPSAAYYNHPIPHPEGHKNTGMGGFPTPLEIIRDYMPSSTKNKLARPVRKLEILTNLTMNKDEESKINRLLAVSGSQVEEEESWTEMLRGSVAKWMPEGLGGMVIGRNSRFWSEELDDEELEQIGGVEYRALRLLSYLVTGYMLVCQVIPFAIISIYLAKVHKWDSAFEPTQSVQIASADKTWYSLFLSASAFTGTGMSLVDQGLAPFQNCYLMIYVLVFVLLAGNHAFPIILRFIIWLGTKITRRGEKFETLHFLLDHPRRCFLYLFPSHQTWYLLFVVLAFIAIELLGFLVLNIGLPVMESLSGFEKFSDGLLQSLSVRASGFGIVAICNMAPSVLFLYIILMYVAIYPIAMSVRSTNVYEEKALGVYEQDDTDTLGEDEPEFKGRRHEVFSKYLLWHMRKQLAFDIWPLAVAIFLICCFERGKLMDPEKYDWFTVFRILFECTSAYSVIGLSLGTPNNNFSFVGEFGYASKIVIICVMLRGRHRGLPVAIDRAILLPKEYSRIGNAQSLGGNGNNEKEGIHEPNTTPRNGSHTAKQSDGITAINAQTQAHRMEDGS
ncbi:hypothetical protein I302_102456 [Kwoniella bestiolae CBS 10118]|uniref:Potassium ion transporter n=1 Tax=Kwoniella bestiolae CBS 10118 TaxID=1296100 RepID=A0A1B9GF19_9TREE|nr:hypothetical protein I302_01146 [Kwoniella bestiolae CBS 10118]OCF29637.1 hypothetical protein I302_01146 [Kwoniella bestiolae CBS 10118]